MKKTNYSDFPPDLVHNFFVFDLFVFERNFNILS